MYKTVLEIEGKTYSLSSVNISSYNRGSGYDPMPTDQSIQFQIRTLKMDQFMWDWVNGKDIQKKNGKIKILNADDNSVIQTIIFDNGFSSSYNMSFYQTNEYSNETSVTLITSGFIVQVNAALAATPGAKKD